MEKIKLKTSEFSITNIKSMVNSGNLIIDDCKIFNGEKYFLIFNNDNKFLIFKNSIEIILVNDDKKENGKIYKIESQLQLFNLLKQKNFILPYIKTNENKRIYLNRHNIIDEFTNLKYTIYNDNSKIKELINNEPKSLSIKFKPIELSENFYEYFKYSNIEEKNEFFEYYNDNNDTGRKKLERLLCKLAISTKLSLLKITGTTCIGKSTTLLKFSRNNMNILYFNLKYFREQEKKNNYVNIINTFIEECKRLYLKKDNLIEQLNYFFVNSLGNNYIKILIGFINIIKNDEVIIILDQFKNKDESYHLILCELEKIKRENLKTKFIICSSINEYEIKDEIIKVLNKFNGVPSVLNTDSQNYYFYFDNLFYPRKNDKNKFNSVLQLFNFIPKYVYMFKKLEFNNISNSINNIKNHIIQKILQTKISIKEEDIGMYFLLIKNNIKINLEYTPENIKLLEYVPLKYFQINFQNNYFHIDYLFPFISEILDSKISIDEVDNFFKQKKENNISYLNSYIKSYYFEFAAKFRISNLIKNEKFEIIKVNEIVHMTKVISNILFPTKSIIFEALNLQSQTKDNTNYNMYNFKTQNKDLFEILDETFKNQYIYNIDYYKNKVKNINNKIKNKYDLSKFNLLIDQEFISGKPLDQAYIFGDNTNKTLVGFQIKCYSNKTGN